MNNPIKYISVVVILIIGFLLNQQMLLAQEGPPPPPPTDAVPSTSVSAEIDLNQTSPRIDRLLYGHFIENLSNWFEGGLWAEMLGDRKFFYPVDNSEELNPPNSRDWILGRWRPLGPESAITMDKDHSYVGEHSPRIEVEAGNRRGIQQDSLPLEAGKQYEGRVILAATTSAAGNSGPQVEVSLVWGNGSDDRQTITINDLTSEYKKYPFTFTAGSETEQGRIEITGTGTGSFLVGAVSLMPADNIEGFRPDILELHREMGVTMLRLGGNWSSGYEWRDGIGDRDKRPPRYDYAWDAVEQNDVGTFEFLKLCELIGAEPNIGVNAGFGDAWSARQWVEYVNGSKDTPMGKLRAKHGHPEPFGVKWWGIGNEMYGAWQLGHMSLEHFTIKHNMFADRMREVDPDIILVASGATPYEMNTILRHFPDVPERPIEFGSRYDWTGGLLEKSAEHFDYIAEHIYPLPRSYFDVERQEFVETDDPLIDVVRRPANRVKGAVEAWQTYEERMPWLKSSDKKIVWDEWIAGGGGLQGALGTANVLHEIFRHTELFKMSAYTCAPCIIDYDGKNAVLEAIGLVFKLYSSQFEEVPVKVNGDSPHKEVRGTVLVDKPEVTSGSPTYPLDIAAAVSRDESTLTFSVVNATGSEQQLDLSITGGTLDGRARHWIISGPGLEARNEAGKEPQIMLEERSSVDLNTTVTVEPLTVNMLKVSLQ